MLERNAANKRTSQIKKHFLQFVNTYVAERHLLHIETSQGNKGTLPALHYTELN